MREQGWDADVMTAALREIIRQGNEITRLRKALRLYADGEWADGYPGGVYVEDMPSGAIIDTGHIARAALKEDT